MNSFLSFENNALVCRYGDPREAIVPGFFGVGPGLYSVKANGRFIPFNNISEEVNGSMYALSTAALLEVLPVKDGEIQDGEIIVTFKFGDHHSLYKNIRIEIEGDRTVKIAPPLTKKPLPSFAYQSISWDLNKNGEDVLQPSSLKDYFAAGFTFLYDERFHLRFGNQPISPEIRMELDRCLQLGKKTMLDDEVFRFLARQKESLYRRELIHGDFRFFFENEEALSAFVHQRLSLYIDEPCLMGVAVIDEPTYYELLGGVRDLLPLIRQAVVDLGRPDFFVHMNLFPITAWREVLAGVDAIPGDAKANYYRYLDAYIAATGLDYISSDIYPIRDDIKGIESQQEMYFAHLLLVREYCSKHHLRMIPVIQTNSICINQRPVKNHRVMNYQDINYLITSCLLFHADVLSFFTYHALAYSNEVETWFDSDSFLVNLKGEKTKMYHQVNALLSQVDAMSAAIYETSYRYAKVIKGSETVISADVMAKYVRAEKDHELLSATSSLSDTLLVKSKGSKFNLYAVQNMDNDKFSNKVSTITLMFAKDVSWFEVYRNGAKMIVEGSKSLSLLLSSGNGAFIIPHYEK